MFTMLGRLNYSRMVNGVDEHQERLFSIKIFVPVLMIRKIWAMRLISYWPNASPSPPAVPITGNNKIFCSNWKIIKALSPHLIPWWATVAVTWSRAKSPTGQWCSLPPSRIWRKKINNSSFHLFIKTSTYSRRKNKNLNLDTQNKSQVGEGWMDKWEGWESEFIPASSVRMSVGVITLQRLKLNTADLTEDLALCSLDYIIFWAIHLIYLYLYLFIYLCLGRQGCDIYFIHYCDVGCFARDTFMILTELFEAPPQIWWRTQKKTSRQKLPPPPRRSIPPLKISPICLCFWYITRRGQRWIIPTINNN